MSVISVLLLLLVFLDHPFKPGVGALKPDAMERSLATIDAGLAALGGPDASKAPCDARGRAL